MTTVPPRASSIWDALPAATQARREQRRVVLQEAAQQAAQRRSRVLVHEWACKRLCAIFGYERADQWNGYVPPRADPLPDRGPQVATPNDSPFRKALVQLLRDVAEFDATGRMPTEVLEAVELPIPDAAK